MSIRISAINHTIGDYYNHLPGIIHLMIEAPHLASRPAALAQKAPAIAIMNAARRRAKAERFAIVIMAPPKTSSYRSSWRIPRLGRNEPHEDVK